MTSPLDRPGSGPVAETARIEAIDVLRGFALLGILVMNIQGFAMPQAAYFNPTAYGDLEGANLYVWLAGRMLADQKFMAIFSMLFGAGIVLMAERSEGSGGARLHYRRMGYLLVIGLLHAHLLWHGDILVTYAVCGMAVYLLQSVLCTTLFYGHGLGWFGSVDRLGQVGLVAGVWAVQLLASPLWLRRFRFGPAEWAWRSLAYATRQPLKRTPVPRP